MSVWWSLIESARVACGPRADDRDPADDPLPEAVLDRVAALPPPQIIAFEHTFLAVFRSAYLAPLWAAAHLIEGGCGDDGFMDFRAGLMLQGRPAFERALADPDSLAALPVVIRMASTDKGWLGCDELLYVARHAYARRTGSEAEYHAAFADPAEPPTPLRGDRWDDEDDEETRRRLPQLAALFLPV